MAKDAPLELAVIIKTYDLCVWFLPHIAKFPRSHRFTLGDRLEVHLLDLLERLIEAKYTRDRASLLSAANVRVQKIRFLVRMGKDLRLLPVDRYEFAARALEDIGRQIGGWSRKVAQAT